MYMAYYKRPHDMSRCLRNYAALSFTNFSGSTSSFLVVNFTANFERERKERGQRMRNV